MLISDDKVQNSTRSKRKTMDKYFMKMQQKSSKRKASFSLPKKICIEAKKIAKE